MGEGLLLSVGKLALTVAIAVPLAIYLLQDRLIFHRQPLPEARRESLAKTHTSVFLEAADGTRLHAWHVKAPPGAPLVMYFGGNAEEVSWMLEEVTRRTPGIGWLLVDYRGYGGSDGSPSEAALVSDALLWYDRIATTSKKAYVVGRSVGSGVAVRLASERPVAGVILIAPFDSLLALAKHYYPYLPVSWMLKHRFESVARAPKIDVPLLCLVAERDEVIPVEHSRRLYAAWAGPKRWVELAGAGHNSTDGAPAFWESIRKFIHE